MKHIAADDNDLLDLVDENDIVIGTINQVDTPTLLQTKAGNVRGVAVFIQNNEGRLWIPRRAPNKRIAPNGIDFSVAEHVQAGETYEHAIVRGFKEELLLDVNGSNLTYLGKLNRVPDLPHYFIKVFLYPANKVKEFNHADYSGFEWLMPEEIVKRIDEGEATKNALKAALIAYF